MRRVRVLVGGLTMTVVLSACAPGTLLLILVQEEREKLQLAEQSPVPPFNQVTRSNHSASQVAGWAMLPRR